jgi:hypothetical protein
MSWTARHEAAHGIAAVAFDLPRGWKLTIPSGPSQYGGGFLPGPEIELLESGLLKTADEERPEQRIRHAVLRSVGPLTDKLRTESITLDQALANHTSKPDSDGKMFMRFLAGREAGPVLELAWGLLKKWRPQVELVGSALDVASLLTADEVWSLVALDAVGAEWAASEIIRIAKLGTLTWPGVPNVRVLCVGREVPVRPAT